MKIIKCENQDFDSILQNIKINKDKNVYQKVFTLQMTISDKKYYIIDDLPKKISQSCYKLNKYFMDSKNLKIERNVLTN